MLKVFSVGHSGYYAWCGRKPSLRSKQQCANEVVVKAVHTQTRETHGYRRLHSEVSAQGHQINQWRVRRTRQRLGLRCKQSKKFKVTTQSNHDLVTAPNLLNQQFNPSRPNEVWVVDITYIWTDEGWLYLAGVKDVYTCEIVGYAMSSRMTKELCMSALQVAVICKKQR